MRIAGGKTCWTRRHGEREITDAWCSLRRNAVKLAYAASVESQLKTARNELSTLYKTQAQNAQRLISLNEQMRDKDDRERDTSEEMRRLQDEVARIKRKEGDLRGVVGEKDTMIQVSGGAGEGGGHTRTQQSLILCDATPIRCFRTSCLRSHSS